ncbi:DgyrCDS8021 [Dimorphilus gyrociliatus]|uniref:DgyrCDS8021 n=1 Tax=Dimorphilus gyrociliatus TaxID=2664684 RepID=A0A7I8VXW3_9ANNE|nr:DgyrCDS8021 [Dimorphilus gyrociliatus]
MSADFQCGSGAIHETSATDGAYSEEENKAISDSGPSLNLDTEEKFEVPPVYETLEDVPNKENIINCEEPNTAGLEPDEPDEQIQHEEIIDEEVSGIIADDIPTDTSQMGDICHVYGEQDDTEDQFGEVVQEEEQRDDNKLLFVNECGEIIEPPAGDYITEGNVIIRVGSNSDVYECEVANSVDIEEINDSDIPMEREQTIPNDEFESSDASLISSAPLSAVMDSTQDDRFFLKSPDYQDHDPFLSSAQDQESSWQMSNTNDADPSYIPKGKRKKEARESNKPSKIPKLTKEIPKRIRFPTGPAGLPKMPFPVAPPDIFPFPSRSDTTETKAALNKLNDLTKLNLQKDGTVSGAMFVQKSLEREANSNELALTMTNVRHHLFGKKNVEETKCNGTGGWRVVKGKQPSNINSKTNLLDILTPTKPPPQNFQTLQPPPIGPKTTSITAFPPNRPGVVPQTVVPKIQNGRSGFIARPLDPYQDPPAPYPGSNPLTPVIIPTEGLPPAVKIDEVHSRAPQAGVKNGRHFKCNQCTYSTTTPLSHFRHWLTSHCSFKPYECYYCRHQTHTLELLNRHCEIEHRVHDKFYRIVKELEMNAAKRYNEIFGMALRVPMEWAGNPHLPQQPQQQQNQQMPQQAIKNGQNFVHPVSGKPLKVHKYRVDNLISCGLLSVDEAKLPPIQMSAILMQRLRSENGTLLLPPQSVQQMPQQQPQQQQPQQPQQQQVAQTNKDTKDSDYESSSPQSDDKLKHSPNSSPAQTTSGAQVS